MRFRGILPTAVAIAIGFILLAGAFFGHTQNGSLNKLGELQLSLLNWAIILAAFALLVGVVNLLIVHTAKIRQKQKGSLYSVFLIFFLLLTLVIGLIPGQETNVSWLFNSIQLPVEASLMALLAITLTYASIRLLRQRLSFISVIFILFALFSLIGTAPLPIFGSLPFMNIFRPFVAQVLAAGGARGILLGVALGTLTTGLRILLGADRPYGGK